MTPSANMLTVSNVLANKNKMLGTEITFSVLKYAATTI